ncbi:MAG: DNA-binding response regulator, partial [Spirochaetae bacterium HGW-Spirochaetae-6]
GLKLAIQYNPDLILLDLMIPKMNGPQFIKKYRELRQKHLSPIVVVSAVSRSDVIQPILKMGVKDYILKPISLEMLNEKITRNIL